MKTPAPLGGQPGLPGRIVKSHHTDIVMRTADDEWHFRPGHQVVGRFYTSSCASGQDHVSPRFHV